MIKIHVSLAERLLFSCDPKMKYNMDEKTTTNNNIHKAPLLNKHKKQQTWNKSVVKKKHFKHRWMDFPWIPHFITNLGPLRQNDGGWRKINSSKTMRRFPLPPGRLAPWNWHNRDHELTNLADQAIQMLSSWWFQPALVCYFEVESVPYFNRETSRGSGFHAFFLRHIIWWSNNPKNIRPWRLTWNIIIEVWFRSFSFLNGWWL